MMTAADEGGGGPTIVSPNTCHHHARFSAGLYDGSWLHRDRFCDVSAILEQT